MKYDVFISYRRKNAGEMARLIEENLKAKGLNCFLDVEKHENGDFSKRIQGAIHNSSNFILILAKNTLNDCVNEEDWVRREILEASGNCTIIPVIYPDFKWPKKLYPQLPDKIINLENQQGVTASHEYFPYMIQRIIELMTNVTLARADKGSLYSESSSFITDKAQETANLISVDMAFHAGGEWHRNSEMVDSMSKLIDMGCKVRVIVNSSGSAEAVCMHMRQKGKKYVDFDTNIKEWKEFADEYPESIQLRVLDVPLMHRLYIVRGADSGSANVKYYSYGNYNPSKDFRLTFDSPSPEYTLYAEEFNYLWEIAREI